MSMNLLARPDTNLQRYFCKGYVYGEKADLSKGYWNCKRKMWATTHFSEIIKQP